MAYERIIFRTHAIVRMQERKISEQDVRHVLETGKVIEDYPGDTPYPSQLILGWIGPRPLHVVAADNTEEQVTVVITVYEPDPDRWEDRFSKRK